MSDDGATVEERLDRLERAYQDRQSTIGELEARADALAKSLDQLRDRVEELEAQLDTVTDEIAPKVRDIDSKTEFLVEAQSLDGGGGEEV